MSNRNLAPAEIAHRSALYAALLLFQSGELSAGAAAELAEDDRFTFSAECRRLGIPFGGLPGRGPGRRAGRLAAEGLNAGRRAEPAGGTWQAGSPLAPEVPYAPPGSAGVSPAFKKTGRRPALARSSSCGSPIPRSLAPGSRARSVPLKLKRQIRPRGADVQKEFLL